MTPYIWPGTAASFCVAPDGRSMSYKASRFPQLGPITVPIAYSALRPGTHVRLYVLACEHGGRVLTMRDVHEHIRHHGLPAGAEDLVTCVQSVLDVFTSRSAAIIDCAHEGWVARHVDTDDLPPHEAIVASHIFDLAMTPCGERFADEILCAARWDAMQLVRPAFNSVGSAALS